MKQKTVLVLLILFVPAALATVKPGDLDTTFNPPLGWVFYGDANF